MQPVINYEDLGLKDYKEVWDYQEDVFKKGIQTKADNRNNEKKTEIIENKLIFVEHPHVFTLGKSGEQKNLLITDALLKQVNASFYKINRGGDITYHGPGQIVGYPIFDLEQFNLNVKSYIYSLEEAIIKSLSEFGIKSERLEGATGVWLDTKTSKQTRKICAIGVKASRYITMHGFALNVNTNLQYFSYINPCGFIDKGVTSMEKELGEKQDFESTKEVVKRNILEVFLNQ